MGKIILLLMLVVASTLGHVRAQSTEATIATCDSVVYQATFYFQSGIGKWIQQSDYTKMDRLLRWAQSNATTPIEITGWADKTGTLEQNEKLSLRRACAIRNYLVRKGISSERISFEGQGVDTQVSSDDKARRADVRGVIRLAMVAEPANEPQNVTPIVAPQPAEQPKQEVVAVSLLPMLILSISTSSTVFGSSCLSLQLQAPIW